MAHARSRVLELLVLVEAGTEEDGLWHCPALCLAELLLPSIIITRREEGSEQGRAPTRLCPPSRKGQKSRAGDAALHRNDRGAPPEQREVNLSSRVKHFNYNSYNMYK